MHKFVFILLLFPLLACSSQSDLPREGRFKADKVVACDDVMFIKAIMMNIKRGKIQEAQNQIDNGIAKNSCVLYHANDTPIIKHYENGYVKFKIKGTDNTPKRAFFTSAELVNY